MAKSLKNTRILLVGNYPLDGQRSMDRFASLLHQSLEQRQLCADIVRPPVIFNFFAKKNGTLTKWLGYLDKLILFPFILWIKSWRYDIFHICDHSNSHYLGVLKHEKTLVTCHDCLAIRAARDEFPQIQIGKSGKVLQKYILSSLKKAKWVACDSESSRQDVLRLTDIDEDRVSVLYLGRQEAFQKLDERECKKTLSEIFPQEILQNGKYILQVSNNNWYKNRLGLVRLYAKLLQCRPHVPHLVIAGATPSSQVQEEIEKLGIKEKVTTVSSLSDHELCCIYNSAEYLLFPSFEEGFGWPILEAYSCGCRVITSGRSSMRELAGDAAFYGDPYQIETFLEPMMQALDEGKEERLTRIKAGYRQVAKFSNDKMTEDYLNQYSRIFGICNS